jgi:hypothetical protein
MHLKTLYNQNKDSKIAIVVTVILAILILVILAFSLSTSLRHIFGYASAYDSIAQQAIDSGWVVSPGSNAWSESTGWIDFAPSQGGVYTADNSLIGYAYGENIGWISLNCENTGTCSDVNYGISNDGQGNLSGFAWSENVGWIDFGSSTKPYEVAIGTNGDFHGYAYGENIGWISMNSDNGGSYPYKVSTVWRIAPSAPSGFNATTSPTCNTGTVLTWSSVPSVLGYRVFRDSVQIATTTELSYNDTGVVVDSSHSYSVQSYISVRSSTSTDSVAATAASSCGISLSSPTLSSALPTNINRTSVTLNATVTNDGGASTTIRGFNYGTSTSYTSVASTTSIQGNGAFHEDLQNLACSTTYHYNAFAVNSVGTATTSDNSFNTSSCGGNRLIINNTGSSGGSLGTSPSTSSAPLVISTTTQPDQNASTTTLAVVVPVVPQQPVETPQQTRRPTENPPETNPVPGRGSRNPTSPQQQQTVSEVTNTGINSSTENTVDQTVEPTGFLGQVSGFINQISIGIKEVVNQSYEASAIVVKGAVNETRIVVTSPTGSVVTKVVSTTGIVTGTAASVSAIVFATPISFSEIWLLPMRLLGLLLNAAGLRRRNRPWGTVYDSVTKRPIDPAYVSLIEINTGKEVASAITDLDGRYGFLVPPGKYRITARKTNYLFPSTKVHGGNFDEVYSNLYFGDEITVVQEGDVIMKNIPMDSQSFDWNEFTKNKKGKNIFIRAKDIMWAKVSRVFLWVGLVIALVSLVFAPAPYNILIFALYIVFFVLNITGIKTKKAGILRELVSKIPLSFAIVRIFREGDVSELIHKIADKDGEYYCLVPNGNYFIKVEKKNDDGTYSLAYQSSIFKVNKGVINSDLEV